MSFSEGSYSSGNPLLQTPLASAPAPVVLTPALLGSLKVSKIFKDNTQIITSLDFDDSGTKCVTSAQDESLHVYDCVTGKYGLFFPYLFWDCSNLRGLLLQRPRKSDSRWRHTIKRETHTFCFFYRILLDWTRLCSVKNMAFILLDSPTDPPMWSMHLQRRMVRPPRE